MSNSHLMDPRPLILGSTSTYRAELLRRLGLPFTSVSPSVDETPMASEPPQALALRLALVKAQAVAKCHPEAIVIGSDQVADLYGQPLGKPGTEARAVAQLQAMRGQTVMFHTAVSVVCEALSFAKTELAVIEVKFRDLSDDEIKRYVAVEQPLDCAGSAKSEGLGISLLAHIRNDDPTALIGLPLIRTCQLLREVGLMTP